MSSINLHHIYKVYPNGVKAVNDFNLEIPDGEFVVFVGPSGCGKSTTLRMIAGLEDITSGELFIGGKMVNALEPKDRDIAFVFQNYALYPHMTVYENMAFGLHSMKILDKVVDAKGNPILDSEGKEKMAYRKLTNEEVDVRIAKAAEALQITEYLKRKPKEMSGGQRQRVALGRALVRDPKVFLLDEPLSNLDAKLRTQMRTEITKLHQTVKTTFIYVTHDQTEAMTMGDRIVVMKDGFIQQIDAPMNLYNKPANKFVAGFIGTPQMNFLNVTMKKGTTLVTATLENGLEVKIPYEMIDAIPAEYLKGDVSLILGLRAESILLTDKGLPFRLNVIEQLGNDTLLYGDLINDNGVLPLVMKVPTSNAWQVGQTINVSFDMKGIHLFDKESEESLLTEVPASYSIVSENHGTYMEMLGKKVMLPPAIASRLVKGEEYRVVIPSDAIKEGADLDFDFTFQKDGLAKLEQGGLHYYFKVNKCKKYALAFERLAFYKENEEILSPIPNRVAFEGKILWDKHDKETPYRLGLLSTTVTCPNRIIVKAAAIDGKSCHKKAYRFESELQDISIVDEGGLEGQILKILDYGTAQFAEVLIGEDHLIVRLDRVMQEGDTIHLNIDFEKVHLLEKENGLILL